MGEGRGGRFRDHAVADGVVPDRKSTRPADAVSPTSASSRPVPARRWVRHLLGLAVILLWSAHLVTSFTGGYQLVNHSRAVEDLALGRITQYALVQEPPGRSGDPWWSAPDLTPASPSTLEGQPAFLVYTIAHARPRLVVSDDLVPTVGSWSSWSTAEADWIEQELLASGPPRPFQDLTLGRAAQVHGILGLVLAGGMLLHVVLGPVPRHGTRWFWFWLIGLPAGLGVLAYAVWEVAPWRDHRVPAPARRSSGAYGVAILLLGGFLIRVGAIVLSWLLGISVLPV